MLMTVAAAGSAAMFAIGMVVPGYTHEPIAIQEFCTVGTIPTPTGGAPATEVPLVMSCFDSREEAEAFIQAGAPGDLEQLTAAVGDQARGTSAVVVIGKAWKGTSRTGSELIHYGTGSGCYGVTYGFPSLPSGWNDAIRSAEGFNNCWVTLYADTSYGGSSYNCIPYSSLVGPLDQKASSIIYRPWGTYG